MTFSITAVVTVIPKDNEEIPAHDSFFLKFASSDLDSDGHQMPLIEGEVQIVEKSEQGNKYATKIQVPRGFGDIGAVIVEVKENSSEKFIKSVYVVNLSSEVTLATFSCNSWIQPKNLMSHQRRIFFSTKSYLLGDTPVGLVRLREEGLANVE